MAWFFGKKKKKAKEAEKKVEPSTPVSQPEVKASPDKVKEAPTNTTPVKEPESKPEPAPAKEVSSAAPVNEEPQLNEAEKYDRGLERSRKSFGQKLSALFTNFSGVDDDFYDDLEETLIEADVGFDTALEISEEVREEIEFENVSDPEKISQLIVRRLVDLYTRNGSAEDNHLVFSKEGPTVFLFVGVNGVGKTTSIGKMAARFKAEKSDPAAVAFEAVKKAKAENYDLVFIDTAGRLQNKVNLMKELDKIKRVISREIPDAPQESLLVLDSTTGQNALTQAKAFLETTNVTGIILTKLDGTAKGGIVLAIRNQLHLAVKYVGLGEKVEDLSPFNPEEYVRGLFKGLLDE